MAKHDGCVCTQPVRRKVKTGCRTCKLRKVKCDEAWPTCRRCQSSGRVCDGYGVWGGGNIGCSLQHHSATDDRNTRSGRSLASIDASLTKPLQLIPLTTNEYGCYEWYMRRSAVKLPGAFPSDYWTKLLFQASTSEAAVRHAVLALASAHMEEVRGANSLVSECNDDQTLFTVQQYSKAIYYLRPCLFDSSTTSVRLTLIACALFVHMEFLRGHYTKGLVHLEHGLGLLPRIESSFEGDGPSSVYIDGWLITIFTRFLVQAKLLGQDLKYSHQSVLGPGLQLVVDRFRSIHHARRSLEHIMLRVFGLQEQSYELTVTPTAKTDTARASHLDSIRIELQMWMETHEATMLSLPPRYNPLEVFAYHLLLLYYRVATIQAGTCLPSTSEMSYDQHIPVFLRIISQCIELYNFSHPNGKRHPKGHHDPEPSSPNSVSDIGWIAPLYFTAIKCRNHRIRHQAIKLLELTPHKEGIFSANLVIALARKVMDIEEGKFYDYLWDHDFDTLAVPTHGDLATPTLPEEFRLSKIDIRLPDDRAGKLLLRCCRGGMIRWINQQYDLPSGRWHDVADATYIKSLCRPSV